MYNHVYAPSHPPCSPSPARGGVRARCPPLRVPLTWHGDTAHAARGDIHDESSNHEHQSMQLERCYSETRRAVNQRLRRWKTEWPHPDHRPLVLWVHD